MRRLIIGLALLAGLGIPLAIWAKPAFAQFSNPDQEKADKATDEQVDRQYKSTLNKTRDSKPAGEVKFDPWSNMRPAETPKPKR